jgi:tetratricopeptide (TPR) repeat protein
MLSTNDRLKMISDLIGSGRHSEALAASEEALRDAPGVPAFGLLRAATLMELRRYEEAIDAVDLVVDAGFRAAPAFVIRGHSLWRSARHREAVAAFDTALLINPGDRETHENLGRLLLSLGDFERGWLEYEHRTANLKSLNNHAPRWNGEDISGKRLLIATEQGLGDTLQFVRYVPLLRGRGAQITAVVQPALIDLLATCDRSVTWTGSGRVEDGLDYQIDLLSLPLVFGTRLETIPADIPYISADPDLVSSWGKALGAHGFRIAIAWQGSVGPRADRERTFPLSVAAALSEVRDDVRLISIQGIDGLNQLSHLSAATKLETLGDRIASNPRGISEIAAVMENCDLVVTSDTMTAHLAGALGRPVWVALKYDAEWRWLRDRSDSPWYPGMRLFRQKAPGEWLGVFERIREALTAAIDLHET